MDLSGTTVAHYRISGEVGRGGMGVVYRAEDSLLKRSVALKFLPPELTEDQHARERFIREARSASALDHPNICTIYEIGHAERGQLYIAMALYEGETLQDRIAGGPLSVEECTDIIRQIAAGLAKAHREGIVHRDLKPANVFLTREGVVKILDFGLAKLSDRSRLTSDKSTVGTIAYMSPEQLRGEPTDARSDIWSLGVVAFEMLARRLPFSGEHAPAMMYSIANGAPLSLPSIRSDVPEWLVDLTTRCLAKEPPGRPQSMDDIAGIIDAGPAVDGKPVRRPMRRWKRIISWAAAGVLITIGAWFLWPWNRAPVENRLPVRLGILSFQPYQPDSAATYESRAVQELLASELTGVENLAVVHPRRLNAMVEHTPDGASAQRREEAFQILQADGISCAVDGIITHTGEGIHIQATIVDPSTGVDLYSTAVVAASRPSLPQAVGALAQQILKFIDLRYVHSDRDLRPWLQYRTRNLEALMEFRQASEEILNGMTGAKDHLLKALALDSNFISPRIWMISGLVQLGRMADAEEQYRKLATLEATASPFDRAMIGWTRAYLGNDYASQVGSLEQALRYSPENNILLVNLAFARAKMGDYDGALKAIQPPLAMHWRYPYTYTFAGDCYISLGKFHDARSVLEGSLAFIGQYPPVYATLAALCYKEDDTTAGDRDAATFLRMERESGHERARADEYLGDECSRVQVLPRAEGFYRHATLLIPADMGIREKLGVTLYHLGRTGEAQETLELVLLRDSTANDARFTLARIRDDEGNISAARSMYLDYLNRDSTSVQADQARQRLSVLKTR